MARTSSLELGRLAEDAVGAALESIGVRHEAAGDSTADVLAHIDDRVVAIEVKTTAYATPERVRAIVGRDQRGSAARLLVADHITEIARDELAAAGWSWLDRRGHLYLRAAGVMIDRDIEPLPRPNAAGPADPIAGAAGRASAYAALLDPDRALPVRATAGVLGFSPASISTSRSALRGAGLLERDGLPVVPELFWALAEVWRPERVWLVTRPRPGDTHTNVHDLDAAGWCVTGTAAAVEWGAPVVAVEPLLDLYVPGPVMITIARREYVTAHGPLDASASIAVTPASLVTSRRLPPRREGGWPLAHPLAVALDLAQDRARGREVLEDWTPPPEYRRVW
jgi:hypothetical protein